MHIAQKFVSRLFYNKFSWQLVLALFMIGMAAFFVREQRLELTQIQTELFNSNPLYIFLGIVLTLLYILAQGQMYIHSFKSLNKEISLGPAVKLFLKRNFISVFLPAGGFSSLVFFTKEIEDKGITKSQIHLASTLFGFCSILSVVIVAIPVLAIGMLFTNMSNAEVLGFFFLVLLTISLAFLIYSVSKKGWAYNWLSKARPSLTTILDDMVEQKINRKQVWLTLSVSVVIELLGITHLYICMLAIGLQASWAAAIIGYVVMVILLIASPFLRGLGAIEVSLTFILDQFGYTIIEAATITLLFRFFEFWLPLLAGIASFITKKDSLLLRILPAFIILILGVVNIISSITPAIPARLRLMKDLLPDDLIITSNALVLVFGLILVLLSVFLLKGSKFAWYFALFLAIFSVVGHLLKAADYEESILAFIAGISLLYTRGYYKLKPNPRLTQISSYVLLYSILAVLAYGAIGFYFIDKRHFGVDFHLLESIKASFKLFFLIDNNAFVPLTHFGRYFQLSINIAGAGVILFVIYSLLKPYITKPYNSIADFTDAKTIVSNYGSSALDYFKTYPDKFLFFNIQRTAFISFKVTNHFAIVLEDPVAKTVEEKVALIKQFDAFCQENGFASVFYRVPEESLEFYHSLGRKSLPIGEEAILDLRTFSLDGGKMKPTRSAVNKLTSEDFDFKVYHAPIKEGLLQKLEKVSDSWLRELGQKEVAFTQGVFDRSILKEQTILTIEDKEEKVYAFLNIVPDFAPGEATYDIIRKVNDGPNGVLDVLLSKTFLYLKEQGYQSVNMGLAPLSGIEGINMTQKTIKYAYDNLKVFAQFKGLRKYKEKFYPSWKKKYLIFHNNYHLLQVPKAIKKVSENS